MSHCCAVPQTGKAPATARCPESGTSSKQVNLLTVRSLVRHLPLAMPPTQYYFCDAPGCDTVYFPADPSAPVFRRGDLLVRVGLKEKDDAVPVCYCFGFSRKDVREEVERTGKSTVGDRIKAEVQAGTCACEVKNPSGKCCLGNVVRTTKEAQESLRAISSIR